MEKMAKVVKLEDNGFCMDEAKITISRQEDVPSSSSGVVIPRRSEQVTLKSQIERQHVHNVQASTESKSTTSAAFESQSGQGDFRDAIPKCDDHSGMAMSRNSLANVTKDRPFTSAAPSSGVGSLFGPVASPGGIATMRTPGFLPKDKPSSCAQRIVFISTVKSADTPKEVPSGQGDQTSSGGFPFFKLTTVSTPAVSQIAKPFYVVQRQGQMARTSTFSSANPSTHLTPGRSLIANCSAKSEYVTQQQPMDAIKTSSSSIHQKPIITLHLTQSTGGASSVGSGGGGMGKFAGGPTYTISVEQAKMEGEMMSRHNTAANVLPGKA